MKVAIFGSWRPGDSKWPERASNVEFVEAAKQLGRRLAHARQKVIVGGMSPRTADMHVVEGIVEVAATDLRAPVLVEVVRPDDRSSPYEAEARRAPHLFEFHSRTEGWWQGAHLISVRNADVVMTIGGGKGTYLAGLATIVAKKPLIPIASFGCASEELLRNVEAMSRPDRAGQLRKLNGPWTSHVLDTAVALAGVEQPPRLLLIHGRSSDWLDLKDWLREEAGITNVVVMGQVFGSGESLPEKFERLGSEVDGAIAIATPDDIGGLADRPDSERQVRARQNVWLEVGWFWGRLGRGRFMVLSAGGVEIPSDLQGLEMYPYDRRPREQADRIRAFIRQVAP